MRSIIVVLVAALALSQAGRVAPDAQPLAARILEQEVRDFVACIQGHLKTGLPEHNLPSLDPLDTPELKLDLNSLEIPELSGLLDLFNVHLAGAVNWEITNLKISITIIPIGAKIDLELTWSSVSGSADSYTGDINIGSTHLWGTGGGEFAATDFVLEAHTQVALGPPLNIRSLSIRPHIGSFTAAITGLFDDEELSAQWSAELSTKLAQWLNDNAQIIDERVSKAIMDAINNAQPGEPGEPGGEENIITILFDLCSAESWK